MTVCSAMVACCDSGFPLATDTARRFLTGAPPIDQVNE